MATTVEWRLSKLAGEMLSIAAKHPAVMEMSLTYVRQDKASPVNVRVAYDAISEGGTNTEASDGPRVAR